MNNRISEEIIEIDGKEYTLFMNRQGIVNWERKTSALKKSTEMTEKANKKIEEEKDVVIEKGTNPFEMYSDENELMQELKDLEEIYIIFYWVALYTNHKLDLEEVRVLWEKAKEEYGTDQLLELANQIIKTVNTNQSTKKLKALKPTL